MSKTAFVSGATGFVGRNLIDALLAADWAVVGLHRPQTTPPDLAGVQWVAGDVTQLKAVRAAMPRQPDAVFHAAGVTTLWRREHERQTQVNVIGTRNMARVALEREAHRFVHVSSVTALGLHTGTVTEETPSRGSSSQINYVRTKALAEREIRRALRKGLPGIIVNPGHIMGPYDRSSWSRLFHLVRQRRLPGMPPGGGSFCHAPAVARALIAAAEQGKVGRNYLLGGANTSYAGLVQHIADLLGRETRVRPLSPRLLDVYARLEELIAGAFNREPEITRDAIRLLSANVYCRSKRAEQELGYQAADLDTILGDCKRWLEQNGRL